MICWFELRADSEGSSGRLILFAEVGPIENYEFRKALIEAISLAAKEQGSKLIGFQKASAEMGKKFSKFFKNNEILVGDVQNIDELGRALKTLLARFKPAFELVSPILSEFQKYGVSENP